MSSSVASAATQTAAATATATTDISNYDTGLGGVNQPQNMLFKDMLWWSMGILALIILSTRLLQIGWTQLRHISAMSLPATGQNYWRGAQWKYMPWIKKQMTYAPIWSKRHNREFRISSALSMGTLPTRLQAFTLTAYIASNLVYMFILDYNQVIHWATWAEMRGRSGTLCAANMVPLIILASRNNPLIGMLHISFDTYNLMHRWMGRVVVAEGVIHTVAWLVVQVNDGGWPRVNYRILHESFIASGTVGTVAMVVLLIVSWAPLRHAFYETFLTTHIVLGIVIIACTWVHCVTAEIAGGLPQITYVIAFVVLWLSERLARVVLSLYTSWSRYGLPDAVVEVLPGDCCRVTIHLPRFVDAKPGTHAYLRFLNVAPYDSHPFSIAWVQHKPRSATGSDHDGEGALPMTEKDMLEASGNYKNTHLLRTTVSFIVAAQTGFTRQLYDRARERGQRSVTLKALFEGPYAGHHSLDSYGHAVLVAGATGITHQISYLRHLVQGFGNGVVATRRITLVWVVRDYEALEWVRPWMDEILRLPHRHEILQIRLFVTRPKHAMQPHQNSRTIQIFPGRPNIPVLLRKEVSEQKGAMCVTVCGPGGLADDVRGAVREVLDEGTVIDFVEESFTW